MEVWQYKEKFTAREGGTPRVFPVPVITSGVVLRRYRFRLHPEFFPHWREQVPGMWKKTSLMQPLRHINVANTKYFFWTLLRKLKRFRVFDAADAREGPNVSMWVVTFCLVWPTIATFPQWDVLRHACDMPTPQNAWLGSQKPGHIARSMAAQMHLETGLAQLWLKLAVRFNCEALALRHSQWCLGDRVESCKREGRLCNMRTRATRASSAVWNSTLRGCSAAPEPARVAALTCCAHRNSGWFVSPLQTPRPACFSYGWQLQWPAVWRRGTSTWASFPDQQMIIVFSFGILVLF